MAVDLSRSDVKPLELPVQDELGRSMVGRVFAIVLLLVLLALPIVLSIVPWQQVVPGSGRVSALNPLDRIQTIPAPVSGRLVNLAVQEGSHVREGQVLAEMEDLDPEFSLRLQQGVAFVREQRESAHRRLEAIDAQLIRLQDELDFAVRMAEAEQKAARDKVRAERETLIGLRADLDQKLEDFGRKQRLLDVGQKSILDFEKAESAYELAKAQVRTTEANIDRALGEEEAKAASIERIRAEKDAKIDEVRSKRDEADQALKQFEIKFNDAQSKVERQARQTITAPRDGTVLRVLGAATSDLISRGQALIEFVPDTNQLAVEFWVRGVDAPLVAQGRKARLQFEGWPAVQVGGWPSVAVGTFGGVVLLSDSQAGADGRVRVLVTPDPESDPWPSPPFLRQGVRATGWVQLDTVSAGYEVWRRLNAFPPSIEEAP